MQIWYSIHPVWIFNTVIVEAFRRRLMGQKLVIFSLNPLGYRYILVFFMGEVKILNFGVKSLYFFRSVESMCK